MSEWITGYTEVPNWIWFFYVAFNVATVILLGDEARQRKRLEHANKLLERRLGWNDE